MAALLTVLNSLTGDDDNKLFAPLLNEIKEGQWLGVTVSSQRTSEKESGVVSLIQKFPYRLNQTSLRGKSIFFLINICFRDKLIDKLLRSNRFSCALIDIF